MYKKAVWTYGNTIEIKKYHTFGCPQKGMKRRRASEKSEEALQKEREKQQRNNELQAIKGLDRILVANFTEEDFHCVLTYREAPEEEDAKRAVRNFLNRLRRFYSKHGAELKFVIVTEQESKRIHHHMVVNNVEGVNILSEIHRIWGLGGTHLTPLYEDKDYRGLAEYLLKETKRSSQKGMKGKQRYTCSRNLLRPEPEIKTIKAEHWSESIRVPKSLEKKGYYLDRDSIRVYDDWAGYQNIEYKFIQPTRQQLKRERLRMRQQKEKLGRFLKKGTAKTGGYENE